MGEVPTAARTSTKTRMNVLHQNTCAVSYKGPKAKAQSTAPGAAQVH
jgi:hypothetical protein